jgi:hypothetical protein
MVWILLAALGGQGAEEKRLLYAASPGIRNYVEWGGKGVLVYDIDAGHKLLRRIPSPFDDPDGKVENVKGICASAATRRLYVSTIRRLACIDLVTEKALWVRAYEGGCDRMSISPDGRTIYLPSLEKEHWHVVDGATGDVVRKIVTNSGAHNTVYGADGSRVYLGGLKSPFLFVAGTDTHDLVRKVGPLGGAVRPFTVDGAQKRAYVCVNGLAGFEVADLESGKLLHRVEVPEPKKGEIKRHGCPSHGVGLTPDEKEVWVVEAVAQALHVYDNTADPPRFVQTLPLEVDQPGWITFTIRGDLAYPSTGEVFDVKSRRKVAQLRDEEGRPVQSEKVLEIDVDGGAPVRAGDQFGVGRVLTK